MPSSPDLTPTLAPTPAKRGPLYERAPWSWRRLVWRCVRFFVVLYVSLGAYAYFFADWMLFRPQPSSYRDTAEILKLTSGGHRISARWLPNPRAKLTILYSHGNAEDTGDGSLWLEELHALGFSVFAYDYRGYGTSEGRPSEAGAYEDVNAAFEHVTQKLGVPESRIVAFGSSIGGGPSVDLAARKQLAGLVLQSTFVSAFRVVTRVRLLPFDAFENLKKIPRVRCPVLVAHGLSDGLIAPWHGRALLDAANEPKSSLFVEGAGHNDFLQRANGKFQRKLREFAALVEERIPPASGERR